MAKSPVEWTDEEVAQAWTEPPVSEVCPACGTDLTEFQKARPADVVLEILKVETPPHPTEGARKPRTVSFRFRSEGDRRKVEDWARRSY